MATEPLLIPKNRSKVMAKYYLTKIIYNGLTYFLIWYSNDEDGFLLFDQQMLVSKKQIHLRIKNILFLKRE